MPTPMGMESIAPSSPIEDGSESGPSVEEAFAKLARLASQRNTLEDPEAVQAALEAEEAERMKFDAAPQQ